MSHGFNSCVPNPTCKSGTYKLNSLDDIQSIDKYLGDNSKINWQSQGTPVKYQDTGLLLTMAEDTVGTLLASTFYVWYGKICAKMTTSQGKGVVTAFIMMSDVKDEIDFEFVGVDIHNVQSNYYSQGVTVCKCLVSASCTSPSLCLLDTNSKNLTVEPDTVSKVHEYCIDWKQDELKWLVDGNEERTVKRSDTWNKTSGRFDYPQTPSRIMLSLWPAGLSTNAKGTVDWAGGIIDWHSQYMQNGYYYAMMEQVTVECYDPPAGIKKNGDKSYKYTDQAATNNTVELSNDLVVLGSLMGTGENPGEKSQSASSSTATKSVNMVPGGNPGAGSGQTPTVSAGSTETGTGASATATSSTGSGTFQQQGNGSGSSAGTSLEPGLGKIGGSAMAIVLAVLGLVVL